MKIGGFFVFCYRYLFRTIDVDSTGGLIILNKKEYLINICEQLFCESNILIIFAPRLVVKTSVLTLTDINVTSIASNLLTNI